jgi:hypothetical protein
VNTEDKDQYVNMYKLCQKGQEIGCKIYLFIAIVLNRSDYQCAIIYYLHC